MTQNPFQPTPSSVQSRQEDAGRGNVGVRLLRVLAGVVVPVPVLVIVKFIISDVFYMNRSDPEYLTLIEAYDAGYLFLFFLIGSIEAYLLLWLPLIAFAIALEFVCKGTLSRCLASVGVGGITVAMYFWCYHSPAVPNSKWELAEACSEIFGTVFVFVGVSLFLGLFSRNRSKVFGAE